MIVSVGVYKAQLAFIKTVIHVKPKNLEVQNCCYMVTYRNKGHRKYITQLPGQVICSKIDYFKFMKG